MVPGADHFFAGKLDQMQQALSTWIGAALPAPGDGEMKEAMLRTMHEEARSIFHHALRSSSIAAAFDRRFPSAFPVAQYERIYAVAVGKAALPMLEALRARLPKALDGGVCCAPVLPSERAPGVEYFLGGHPLPNQDSFASARAALRLLRQMRRAGLRLLSDQRRRLRHVRAAAGRAYLA